MKNLSRKTSREAMECMNKIFLAEMGGILQYLHYSFMVMGHNRIPIQKWFRDQADESKMHAVEIGEKITSYGGHPPLSMLKIDESNVHTINQMLEESLEFETAGLELYKQLAGLAAKEDDIALEEYARTKVLEEQDHIDEVHKMMRDPNK